MDEHLLRRALAGLPVSFIRTYPTIGSTNDEALLWVEAGAPDGSLVAADEQTRGRGRLDRRWVTPPGVALAFSLILRPAPWEVERLGLISPLGALAVSTALERDFNLHPQIKWPNDVLLDGRKLCGILLEASWLGDQLQAVVVGIGLNVLTGAVPPPDQVLFPAFSLEDALGRPVDRVDLLASILRSFFDWRQRLASLDFLRAWEDRLAFKGQPVRVTDGSGQTAVHGRVLGVHPSGDLLLRDAAGQELRVTVGDVHLRPEE